MKKCRLALLLAALVLGVPLRGACLERITGSADLNFSLGGVTLPASEREKVTAQIERVRQTDWCPFDTVAITAYAAPSEGNASVRQGLAKNRADYVRLLLKFNGVPESIIFTLKTPPSPTEFKSRADYKRAVLTYAVGSDKLYVASEDDEHAPPPAEEPRYARVELELVGGGGGLPCPYPKNAEGFRERPARDKEPVVRPGSDR